MLFSISILLLVRSAFAFKHPHFFNHWTCLGIVDQIDFSQPYVSNIGELPLVSWKHPKTNEITTTLNICKHMGSKLGNAKITEKGCLQCQYHGLEIQDGFGKTMEHEGKLFWAYQPDEMQPPPTPYFHHRDYKTSFLIIDMEASLVDCALNMMDVRHPEYVHNKLFGFGSNIPPTNLKKHQYAATPDSVGLSFHYQSNKMVQSMINDDVPLTKNFHMYKYPSFTWSKVSFNKNNLIISVHLRPLTPKKTRWYVTLCHNYYTNEIQQSVMRGLAGMILSQDYEQMKNQYEENALKQAVTMDYTFGDEEVIVDLHKMFQENYRYPSIDECARFYKSTQTT